MGLNRSGWDQVHYWLGIAFAVVVTVHVISHWRMIRIFARKLIPSSVLRVGVGLVLLLGTVFLWLGWLFIPPQGG